MNQVNSEPGEEKRFCIGWNSDIFFHKDLSQTSASEELQCVK